MRNSYLTVAVFFLFFSSIGVANAASYNGFATINAGNSQLSSFDSPPQNVLSPGTRNRTLNVWQGTYPAGVLLEGPNDIFPSVWSAFNGIVVEGYGEGPGDYFITIKDQVTEDIFVWCINSPTGTDSWTLVSCAGLEEQTGSRIFQINEPEVGYDIVTSDTTVDFDIDYVSALPVADRICVEINNLTTFSTVIPNCESILSSGYLNFSTTTTLVSANQYQWRVVMYDSNNSIIDITEWSFFTVEVPPYTPWVPDESGYGFGSLPAGTTSTTTLGDLTLECDPNDGFFARSVCNLAVLLFVPSQTSIATLNANMNSLYAKQPFSAIQEFRTAWNNSVRNPTVTPQSLSLTFYGEQTEILSTSTLSAVAGNGALTTIRFLMVVGLWIAFGWWAFLKAKNFF